MDKTNISHKASVIDFEQFCINFSELDSAAANDLFKVVITKTYKKREFLLNTGIQCKNIFFINKGLGKIFFNKDDKEFIVRFFSENKLFSAFESYLTNTPSKFAIMALENTTVTIIQQKSMEELCKKHHCVETFFRKLVSIATLNMTKRIREMLEENATERYNLFIQENSQILQRISLGDIAKYIGITQQSLSRIRVRK